jgi:hypothetical protein
VRTRIRFGTRPANRISEVLYAWQDSPWLTRSWIVALVILIFLSFLAAMLANLGIPTGPNRGLIAFTHISHGRLTL